MERGLVLLLPLCLGLLQGGRGEPLEVEPPEPAVALGGRLELTCRLECPDGQPRSVQWRGLDTSLGSVWSDGHRSVLTVHSASLWAAGTQVCVGSCAAATFQKAVQLLVYAFPDQLSVSPAALTPGREQEVACTALGVMPVDPDALSFSLLLGERELEGAQALGRDEEPLEDEDMLFRVTERWLLPPLGTPAPAALHCQATLTLPGVALSRRQPVPVLHGPAALEPPSTANLEPAMATLGPPSTAAPEPTTTPAMATPEPPSTAGPPPSSTAAPEPPSTAAPEPPSTAGPPPSSTAAPEPPSTAAPEPPSTAGPPPSSTAAPEPPSTAGPEPSTTATQEPPAMAALEPPSMAAPEPSTTAALQQAPTVDPSSASPPPSPAGPCHLEIHQSPGPTHRKGRLELLCVAACGVGVAVRWTRAPGGLAAYERREAGPRAWLALPRAGRVPEGWFQCRLHPGDQVASLYVVPRSVSGPDGDVDVATLWTGSSVLGLLLLAFLAHRLRRRCRSPD
ncbi:LOW QUALITY PROTEIN: mucosal addressin cell adhesion molecule 1 [Dasypus novemcinctus]|uniref:mucosal addressin cell adhesion molecule 1 n=1 Tax=Dasypus novemcinctus TaxID=9361 RepID=UPI00265D9446|nr:LOW QUALITY PROTEIN: mucosal addressin cell adhesion molecule 1 [Dasypus novemcinctus]